MTSKNSIVKLTPVIESRIKKNPLLNMDTFIIPSPYVRDVGIEKDYDHSYVWMEEREILGYLLVYSDKQQKYFHIYKLVSSPFGRGRGIGQAFLTHLAENVPIKSEIYLYLWEKQTDTLEFFQTRGFKLGDSIVYRNLVYYHIHASKERLLEKGISGQKNSPKAAEIGKTRHDARKLVRLLSHMVETLSVENCDKLVEDINRETTTLINMLNIFRDSRKILHEVNLKDLILERIVAYIQASPIKCCLQIKINTKNSVVLGYHENIGRALVNIVSNSLDAIEERGIKGFIKISLAERGDDIILSIRDNGIGIKDNLLELDDKGFPLFVGRTTKDRKSGEGLGTLQIYSAFGPENISISSGHGGTGWKIKFSQSKNEMDSRFVRMNRRFNEFKNLWEDYNLIEAEDRTDFITYIWQLRKMEIFLFDLILMFSNYHNIRTIYRTILAFIEDTNDDKKLRDFIFSLRSDNEVLRKWLFEISVEIKNRKEHLIETSNINDDYQGALLKSYGQALENVIIFTLDPETGDFLASDRKLAEHLDFVPYLGNERDRLLRGEFVGDLNNDSKPIFLGVWNVDSEEDLFTKLKLIRKAAGKMLEIGIHTEKRLAFYQTTYINHNRDIDTYSSTTFGEFAKLSDDGLKTFTRKADDEAYDFLMQVD
ncbi:MAG: GNAT family N-acetyltransferase [Spirochaetales bacterium]|nr:GNAT family N-acetyltransferase [Spirochaetales bacterium]